VLDFAERYDPQPIHVGLDMAATPYEGIIASEWHTASACMALLVEGFPNDTATLGSFGLNELRWRTSVRPNDTSVAMESSGKSPLAR
jgi:acyl dehydratase